MNNTNNRNTASEKHFHFRFINFWRFCLAWEPFNSSVNVYERRFVEHADWALERFPLGFKWSHRSLGIFETCTRIDRCEKLYKLYVLANYNILIYRLKIESINLMSYYTTLPSIPISRTNAATVFKTENASFEFDKKRSRDNINVDLDTVTDFKLENVNVDFRKVI